MPTKTASRLYQLTPKHRENTMQKNATCLALAGLLTMGLLPNSEAAAGENPVPLFEVSGDARASLEDMKSESDADIFTRLRVQAQVNPTENISLTGRVHLSKFFDSEYQDDDNFWIDRMFLNWNDIAATSFSLQAGRLPTMEGGPAYLRLGLDKPQGSLSPFTDFALDGVMLGYKYTQPWSGSIYLYYGTQFDVGYESNESDHDFTGSLAYKTLKGTDIYGLNWILLQQEPRVLSLQSFLFADLYNLREDFQLNYGLGQITFPRENLGDLYHTAVTYQDQWHNLNGFVSLGWSHTNPSGYDDFGAGLLSGSSGNPEAEDGVAIYAGVRYDFADLHSKVGLEYNYGSKYWVNFSQDFDTKKLSTRGSVLEGYWIFSPLLPQAVAGPVKDFRIRLGYQYYWYEYTGSGLFLGEPLDIDEIKADPLLSQFYNPPEHDYKLYASIDFRF